MKNFIIFLIFFLCLQDLQAQKEVNFYRNYDEFPHLSEGKSYRMTSKAATLSVTEFYSTNQLNVQNFISGSLGVSYGPNSKTFSDSTTLRSSEYVRLNFEIGKKVIGKKNKWLEISYLFKAGVYSDIGDHNPLKEPFQFRIIPSFDFTAFNHIFIQGSFYKNLIPVRPTGIDFRIGLKYTL